MYLLQFCCLERTCDHQWVVIKLFNLESLHVCPDRRTCYYVFWLNLIQESYYSVVNLELVILLSFSLSFQVATVVLDIAWRRDWTSWDSPFSLDVCFRTKRVRNLWRGKHPTASSWFFVTSQMIGKFNKPCTPSLITLDPVVSNYKDWSERRPSDVKNKKLKAYICTPLARSTNHVTGQNVT